VILPPLVFPVPTLRTFEGWVPLLLKIDRYFLIVQNVNNSAKMFDNTGHRSNADAETGKKLLTVPSHAGPVRAVAWIGLDDDFGTFASASHDQAGVFPASNITCATELSLATLIVVKLSLWIPEKTINYAVGGKQPY
jgi:hypothetical protein